MNLLRQDYELNDQLNPVLVDAHDRPIDGRHRLQINPKWKRKTYKLRSTGEVPVTDAEHLAAVLEVNAIARGTVLTKPMEQTVLSAIEKTRATTAAKRDLIETALQHDAARSNREIADLTGVDHKTVADIREEIILGNFPSIKIHRYEFVGGRGHRKGKHSTLCWCGEGDYTLPKSKEPKSKATTPTRV